MPSNRNGEPSDRLPRASVHNHRLGVVKTHEEGEAFCSAAAASAATIPSNCRTMCPRYSPPAGSSALECPLLYQLVILKKTGRPPPSGPHTVLPLSVRKKHEARALRVAASQEGPVVGERDRDHRFSELTGPEHFMRGGVPHKQPPGHTRRLPGSTPKDSSTWSPFRWPSGSRPGKELLRSPDHRARLGIEPVHQVPVSHTRTARSVPPEMS